MAQTADDIINERAKRMGHVPADLAPAAWMRELTNEITRLRFDLRELATKREHQG